MIGASKILTVSYGTFSCTLEGFDEPFNTMKAIAEYFRDLAAEDRYFGAEPPTPDAAMLHRIAEREIQRRVEAKIDATGIVLRAGDVDTSVPQPSLTGAAVPEMLVAPGASAPRAGHGATADSRQIVHDPGTDARSAPVSVPAATAVTAPSLSDSIPEGVAAKLARIRQSVVATPAVATPAVADIAAPGTDAPLPSADGPSEDEYSEDEHATGDLPDARAFASASFADVAFAKPDPVADLVAEDEDDHKAAAAIATDQESDAGFDAEETDADDLADLAALDGAASGADAPGGAAPAAGSALDDSIRGALAASLADSADAEPATARQAATRPIRDFSSDDLTDLISTLAGGSGQDSIIRDVVEGVAIVAELDADPVFDVAGFADFDAEADTADDTGAELAADTRIADLFADDPEMDLSDDAFFAGPDLDTDPAGDSAPPRAITVGAADAADPTPPAEPQVPEPQVPEPQVPEPQVPEPQVLEKAQRARARVIKIRRATAPDLASSPVSQTADLSPEAEAALLAELDAAPTATVSDTARKLDPAAEDAAVARLLRQADTEMAVDENRRRLSAIAHLKAAVAATVADRKVGAPAGPSEDSRIDPYREDLARAVRPQRARNEQPGSGLDRPLSDRPAPLVLVSEQRIDRLPAAAPPAAASLMVRPRRIIGGAPASQATQPEMRTLRAERSAPLAHDPDAEEDEDPDNIFTDAKGFAEFAERLGAHGLPDLMEAAAAYVACVEKREHFSRPQLMRRIGAVGAAGELSREDGLISFGTLLRNGRFAKVRRGQYMLAEDSDYLAEARRIAK